MYSRFVMVLLSFVLFGGFSNIQLSWHNLPHYSKVNNRQRLLGIQLVGDS